jgi:hypothetical protein
MKSKAQVTFVDKENPLELEGKKYYKTKFVDTEGFQDQFYSNKIYNFGDSVTVELVNNGGKYKFKVSK